MQEFSLMRLKNKNIKKKYTVETYANYSWVSQLVPVLEMMFGVTRHSVAFHIWCQAQLYRGEKNQHEKFCSYVKKDALRAHTSTITQLTIGTIYF